MRIACGFVATGMLVLGLAGPWADEARAIGWARESRWVAVPPDAKAARRRWALAKMDEMDSERLRCRVRFTKKHEVEACEADYTHRFRQYNEIYLEGLRD